MQFLLDNRHERENVRAAVISTEGRGLDPSSKSFLAQRKMTVSFSDFGCGLGRAMPIPTKMGSDSEESGRCSHCKVALEGIVDLGFIYWTIPIVFVRKLEIDGNHPG
uniref:Uncharacterized protein n=1 Tax=Candidatus Kentrum sp. LFY TaxID=2126342 RepID=A0A450UK49_9GAMM|nr:MAG: hypothetical protein BECKLFY1418A_GA0070994_102720 [Candidatus Kentron sp. LFY]